MKRFLIIGSSGQIGSALAKELMARGEELRGIDPRANPWVNIQTENLPFENISEQAIAEGLYTDLIMLATTASARQLQDRPELDTQDRKRFEKVLDTARRLKLRLTIVSSRELFGIPEGRLADFHPTNPYESQKRDMELEILGFIECGGDALIVRVPVVFGGFDTDIDRFPRLIPRWCKQYLDQRRVEVTNGQNEIEILRAEVAAKKIAEQLLGGEGPILELRGDILTLAELAAAVEAVGNQTVPESIPEPIIRGIVDTFAGLR